MCQLTSPLHMSVVVHHCAIDVAIIADELSKAFRGRQHSH